MAFRSSYAVADYVLLDSRFLANILRVTKRIRLPVCTGSDLTESLFRDVIGADDPLVLIGCSDQQALQLARRYGLRRLAHFNPPMGFIRDPQAVEACLRFIETHSPFRFCLLAVGAPQQEAVAQLLKSRGIARGLAMCIGASINFLTGEERRAPLWMQRCGIEWSFRLLQAPGRMAGRYLVRGPRVFALLYRAAVVLRKKVPLLRLVHVLPHGGAAQAASPDSARHARRA
jgi:exopolysaccharide biosynthesis WecB/TagA/CpsF family protein